jgi:hypothetical protein
MNCIVLFKHVTGMALFALLQGSCNKHDGASQPDKVITDSLSAIDYRAIIKSESQFILAHQLSDGAFTMSSNRDSAGYKIVPYFSNIAARALLENPTSENIQAVKNWISWYFSHLNADGSIYDYFASSDHGAATIIASGDFDSVDSYAATFFSLLRKLCEVSPKDQAWLTSQYSQQIELTGNALFSVIQPDGLTIAKPSYAIEYTMDNAEVNEGFADRWWLSEHVLKGPSAQDWKALLQTNTAAIENHLWDGGNLRYRMYANGPVANWQMFYADATCQLYPIWCGVISPSSSRAQSLWAIFNQHYPDWSTGKIYDAGGYPWTLLSYVSAVMKNTTRTTAYLSWVH